MQWPGGLRELIEAVHGVTALEVPDALKGTVIETMGRQMSEAQQAFNQVVDAEDECDQLQMQRVFDDGLRRPGLPRSRLFPAHAGMNRLWRLAVRVHDEHRVRLTTLHRIKPRDARATARRGKPLRDRRGRSGQWGGTGILGFGQTLPAGVSISVARFQSGLFPAHAGMNRPDQARQRARVGIVGDPAGARVCAGIPHLASLPAGAAAL